MPQRYLIALFAIVLIAATHRSYGQGTVLINPINAKVKASLLLEQLTPDMLEIDSSSVTEAEMFTEDISLEAWKQWSVVENYTFGKDRGTLSMITDLNALHPYFRDRIKELIVKCRNKGIQLAIVETYRTHAKQNEYRGMGRKYTNSAGGRSKHQYGLAVDVVPIVNNKAVWNNAVLWKKIGVTGEKLGLKWGGRWRKPYDPGHFEWTGGLNSNHLSSGVLPAVPEDKYPCIHEDVETLRKYWSEWEALQGATTRK